MDLFASAAVNADALFQRFNSLMDGTAEEARPVLRQFAQKVQDEGKISINMRLSVLLRLVSLGEHQNVYEGADSQAAQSSLTREEILRERLGSYYERRIAFDRHFERGEQLRYGALNLGSLGALRYGEYCAVFSPAFAAGLSELAYLALDSLNSYMLPGPAVDVDRLQQDICLHSHRHYLATLKYAADVCCLPEELWSGLLCSQADYIEAIFVGNLQPESLQVVRMPQVDFEIYFHFAFEEFRGRLSEFDRSLVESFTLTLSHLQRQAIALEGI